MWNHSIITHVLIHNVHLSFNNGALIAFIKRNIVPPRFVYFELWSKAKIYNRWQLGSGHVVWLCYRIDRIDLFVKLCHFLDQNWLSSCATLIIINYTRFISLVFLIISLYYYHCSDKMLLCCWSRHSKHWNLIKRYRNMI